jgi:cyclohexa-1,5-dienecarbonyl-CoA hydratase
VDDTPETHDPEGLRRREYPGSLVLELRRPPVNVLDLAMIGRLEAVLTTIAARPDLRVMGLRSGLGGVFSAGVDVAAHAPDRVDEMLTAFHALARRLFHLPQATVVAVDGVCLGGACELAVLCDVVVASPRARFGQPEIDLGCFPPVAAVALPRLLGKAAAALILGGEPLSAIEALRLGLVTVVAEDVDAEAERWRERLAAKSGVALRAARRALREGALGSFDEALARAEQVYRDEVVPSADAAEGVQAFLEKRPPRFENR